MAAAAQQMVALAAPKHSSSAACSQPSATATGPVCAPAALDPSQYTYNMSGLSSAAQMQLYQQYMCFQACSAAMSCFAGFAGFPAGPWPCPPMPMPGFLPPGCPGFFGPVPMPMPFPAAVPVPAPGSEVKTDGLVQQQQQRLSSSFQPAAKGNAGSKPVSSKGSSSSGPSCDHPIAPLSHEDVQRMFQEDGLLKELEAERFSHCSSDSAFGGPSRAASAASVPEVLPPLFPASDADLGEFDDGAFLSLSSARLVPDRDTKLKVRGGVQKHSKQPGSSKARGQDQQPASAHLEPVDALAIRDLLVDGDDGCGWESSLAELGSGPCMDLELVL